MSHDNNRVWGSRFDEQPTRAIEDFTASISVDQRLAPYDVELSKAHVTMLASVGLVTEIEKEALCQSLDKALENFKNGHLKLDPSLEDIHTHLETFLIGELGDTGRKLHTARSRNDQVATAFRLWCRDHLQYLSKALRGLQNALLTAAKKNLGVVIPAYTHWQRAQPMIASHHFLAHIERIDRDYSRCQDALKRLNMMPLGSAAAVGTRLNIDRNLTAQLLNFEGPCRNSLDATSDRDFVLEIAFTLATVAQHLSSMAEEWIMWTTVEFGFLKLPDRFCTGSSIMPQKKNPDVLELIRGRTGRSFGALMQLMTIVKGLPLGYQRDLQEDKEPLFYSYDSVYSSLMIMTELVEGMGLNGDKIAQTLDKGYLDATSIMEFLIAQGRPMRSAHEKVGRLVKEAEKLGLSLTELPNEIKSAIDPLFVSYGTKEGSSAPIGSLDKALQLSSFGSGSPSSVMEQIEYWHSIFSSSSI
jgi:argininosuccinate lyase